MSCRAVWVLVPLLLVSACHEEPFPTFEEEELLRRMPQLGLPAADPTNRFLGNALAQQLGAQLFVDPTLSGCGTVSCQTCHLPDQGFTYSAGAGGPGCDGNETGRNPPTLLNVAHSEWFMWDGRADRLWSQALLPFLSPQEMAGNAASLRQKLAAPPYAEDYQALFGASAEMHSEDQVLTHFGKALASFQWGLQRTTSPFDRQLTSYLEATLAGTQEEHPLHLGLKVFIRQGQCAVCHKGAALSDQAFHNVGLADDTAGRGGRLGGIPVVLESPFNALGAFSDRTSGPDALAANRLRNLELVYASPSLMEAEEGRGQMEGAFKTPSLRNVALTAPYMHNGSLATLAEVVEFYNRGGDPDGSFAGTKAATVKPLELTDEQKQALLELLELMTGDTGP